MKSLHGSNWFSKSTKSEAGALYLCLATVFKWDQSVSIPGSDEAFHY